MTTELAAVDAEGPRVVVEFYPTDSAAAELVKRSFADEVLNRMPSRVSRLSP